MAKFDFAKGVQAVLTGKAHWAQLTEKSGPNKMSGKYQVELELDKESIALLDSMKITSYLNTKRMDGTPKYETPTVRLKTNNPPQLWDTSRTPFTGLIGNGSIIRAKVLIKSWEMAGKKGLTAYFNKGVILSLQDLDAVDDDELWSDIPEELSAAPTAEQLATPPAASAAQAFDEEDDDLPF